MRHIYTGIDIGTDSIKLVTLEKYREKLNVLASVTVKSQGLKKGLITDATLCSSAIKKGIKELESKLGTKIDKVVAIIPSNNRDLSVKTTKVKIDNNVDNAITNNDVYKGLQEIIKSSKETGHEIVLVNPIDYQVDGKKNILNPVGISGKELAIKAVVASVPKKNLLSVVSVLESIGIEVVDVTFSTVGDYYATKNSDLDRSTSVIVNIGYDTTNISLFNKGVMVKDQILDIGSSSIDSDIDFVYKLNKKDLLDLKENFAVASKRYADSQENYRLVNRFNVKIEIDQYELAEVIEARVVDILKTIKRSINNLTTKEISYIIITGGITDMTGFDSVVDDVFVRHASIMNMNVIGLRYNKYSSCYGTIKYLIDKIEGRDKNYTMFSDTQIEEMLVPRKKSGPSSVLNKIFERFFE